MVFATKSQTPAGKGIAMPLQPSNTAVIILNYNNADDTIACLRSLHALKTPPGQILVVDNHSTDDSCATIVQTWRQWAAPVSVSAQAPPPAEKAVLLQMPTNEGFSAGNNAGIRLALQNKECRAVWLLNNDTEVRPDALDSLCACLNAQPEVGLAGSTLVYAHDRTIVQCAGGFKINKYCGTTPAICGHAALDAVLRQPVAEITPQIDYLCGASMLIKREVFDRIGLFREDYFLYYEDAEFCLRATKARFTLAWAPYSIVYHKEGSTTGAKSSVGGRDFCRTTFVDYLSLRNRAHLVCTYFPSSLPLTVLSYFLVALNRLRRGQPRRIPLAFQAMADGLRNRMGKPGADLLPRGNIRVLFLTLRADFGGGPEHLWQLLTHLPTGFTPFVACPQDYPYYARFCQAVGVENVFVLPHRKFSPLRLLQLRRFCRHHKIRLLHSHGKGAGVYARLLAILTVLPCVHTMHGVHMGEYGRIKKSLYRGYERCMSHFTHSVIAVSQGERKLILQESLVPEKKIRLIENGVALPDKACAYTPTTPFTVVSISRFDFQKNSAFVLEILHTLQQLNRLQDFHFIIVGDGSEREGIIRAAAAQGLGHALTCPGATETPAVFFEGALCYLSTSRWEGLPLAVLEAMAHGLPAVLSDVVGNRDIIVQGNNGFLFQKEDAEGAAAQLLQLADDSAMRGNMALAARHHVARRHSVDTMAKKTASILRAAYKAGR